MKIVKNEYGTFTIDVNDMVGFVQYPDHLYKVFSFDQFNDPNIIVVLEPNNTQTSRNTSDLVKVEKYVPPPPKRKYKKRRVSRIEQSLQSK